MNRNYSRVATRFVCVLSMFALVLFASVGAHAQTFTQSVVYNFCSQTNCADGENNFDGGLIQASDLNFYGAASSPNDGIIYQVTPGGAEKAFYNFCSQTSCTDGNAPGDGLTEGSDGYLYGTTKGGGLFNDGLAYKVSLAGNLTKLYSFCLQTNCDDGENPQSALVQGADGNYYGLTYDGGNGTEGGNDGTLFKITSSGSFTLLYSFCSVGSCSDGIRPTGQLLQAADGNFYGVTAGTCANVCSYGTVFKVTSAGVLTTLYTFCHLNDCADGENPSGYLVQAGDGNLYGYTYGGGDNGNYGTIFQVTPAGTVNTFYSFCSVTSSSICLDGSVPYDGLVVGSDGNLYGMTSAGGANNAGTLFQMTLGGVLTTLYNFCSVGGSDCTDGSNPATLLIQGSDGNFYGATDGGGANAHGVFYKLAAAPALAAPVQVSLSSNLTSPGTPVTLNWSVSNAFSTTMQQCYAHIVGTSTGAGTWSGLQPGTLSAGVYSGSLAITPTTSGTYTYALTCGGRESNSATLTVQGQATLATISASPTSATVGQSVTLTATVSGAGDTPTGTVSFYSRGVLLNTATLSGGVATYTASTATGVGPATYAVYAVYNGGPTYNGTISGPTNVVITKAPTAVALTATPNPVTQGSDITLTAAVTRSAGGASGVPTGTVVFSFGSATLGSVILDNSGVASVTLSTANAPMNTYGITARYSGDTDDNASTSSKVNVTVN